MWHNDIVYHPSHIKHLQFFKKAGSCKEYINPANICGIDYAYSYNCPMYKTVDWRYNWLEFFTDLKRLDRVMDNFDSREDVVNHIHHAKEDKIVYQYGEHYFTMGGQHRLCLAKFLEVPEVEVIVVKHILDKDHFSKEMKFQKYVPELIHQNFLPSNYQIEYRADFMILHIGKESIFIKKKFAEFVLQRQDQLQRMRVKGLINFLKSSFVENHERKHITDESQLYLLDTFLLKHNADRSRNL